LKIFFENSLDKGVEGMVSYGIPPKEVSPPPPPPQGGEGGGPIMGQVFFIVKRKNRLVFNEGNKA
jgi:hypothetical protein